MIGRSPETRHRHRLLAWLALFVASVALVVCSEDWLTPSVDGRHLLLIITALGVVFESERTP